MRIGKKRRHSGKSKGSDFEILKSFTLSKLKDKKIKISMKNFGKELSKFDKVVARIEYLTEEVIKKPNNEKVKKDLKKAEDGLYRMIQEEEKQIDQLLESFNQQEEWEE